MASVLSLQGALLLTFVTLTKLLQLAAADPLDVTALFDVSFSSVVKGNCLDIGQDRLNQRVKDAYELAQMGVLVISHYRNRYSPVRAQAIRAVDAWFVNANNAGELDDDDLDEISAAFQGVQSFLETGNGPGNGQTFPNRPFLFCNDGFLLPRLAMTDQARDDQGAPMTDPGGAPIAIEAVGRYATAKEAADTSAGQPTYPYWNPVALTYQFLPSYGDANSGPCSARTPNGDGTSTVRLGSTFSRAGVPYSFTMLCPVGFSGRNLGPTSLNCVSETVIAGNGPISDDTTVLQQIMPEATVLFHELFHLVWTGDQTRPAVGEVYNWIVLLGHEDGKDQDGNRFQMDTELSLDNPQTFAFLALSWWFTWNAPEIGNRPVEFYTGVCTYDG